MTVADHGAEREDASSSRCDGHFNAATVDGSGALELSDIDLFRFVRSEVEGVARNGLAGRIEQLNVNLRVAAGRLHHGKIASEAAIGRLGDAGDRCRFSCANGEFHRERGHELPLRICEPSCREIVGPSGHDNVLVRCHAEGAERLVKPEQSVKRIVDSGGRPGVDRHRTVDR